MAVDRLEKGLNLNSGHHLYVLYGPGIQDTFITRDYAECGVEAALWRYLHEQGFQRIVFYAPHRGLHFLDSASRARSHPEAAQSSSTMVDPNFPGAPLPDLPTRKSSSNGAVSHRGGSDLQDIDDLHFIMHDSRWRSAIVFPQSENTIHHFARMLQGPARKRFFGYASEWARLPFSNRNGCFWLCGGTAEVLHEVTKDTIPELHVHLEQRSHNPRYSIHRIGGPQREEVERLIDYLRLKNGVDVKWLEREKLLGLMEAEGSDARLWMGRLSEAGEFSRNAARQAAARGENDRWFASMTDEDGTAEERLAAKTGLQSVKKRIRQLKNWVTAEEERRQQGKGKKESAARLHFMFKGNPGTGKTTVARLMAEIFRDMGLLRRGHYVEVAKANELIGQYVGHTALRTHEKIDEALDGILFIDEAYQLAETSAGFFGMEAIRALLTRLENDRDNLIVVVAGYVEEMDLFVNSVKGLRRRFPRNGEIIFENYSSDELMEIWQIKIKNDDRYVTDEVNVIISKFFEARRQHPDFENVGELENIYDAMVQNWSDRITENNLSIEERIRPEDIPKEYMDLVHTE